MDQSKITLDTAPKMLDPRKELDKLKLGDLAADVLQMSINKLLVNLRFLDAAMNRLRPVQYEGPVAVDGACFYYSPYQLLLAYRQAREIPAHAYLHGVLHCIFRHYYIGSLMDKQCWDLACDIAVEAMILEMDTGCTRVGDEERQQEVIDRLKGEIGAITAEKLYRHFLDGARTQKELQDMKRLFIIDNHDGWYDSESPGDEEEDFGQDSPSSGNAGENDEYENKIKESLEDDHAPRNNDANMDDTKGEWEDVAEKLQLDLESFSKERGDRAGTMMQNLRAVNREKYDYADFLRKFSVMGEAMQVNNDEFDYIFYTYGLEMYGKMPLIEPLEYKEVKKIKDFVIAIDTSGSVNGELVQRFINKTYNILQQQENFFHKINLHIIQCDQEIQEDVKIENKEQFDAYMDHLQLKGMGGTDFRPVFSYVDDMIKAGELKNLKGLIYFTDGDGKFPARQPAYDAAFVFVDDDYNAPDVPVWAIRLVLGTDEI